MTNEKRDPMWWTMYAMFAPIITWPGYESEVSEKQKTQIQLARMEKTGSGDLSEKATNTEVSVYLSTASLAQPLNSEWANIYFYAAAKAFPALKETIDRNPELKPYDKDLSSDEKKEYEHLARWIFKQQETAMKNKYRLKA
jgi:hypothetical protein